MGETIVRRYGRLPILIFVLTVLLPGGLAHANGVHSKLAPMQPVTGRITGKGSDSYTFNVAQGTSFVVTVVETGVHDPNFMPVIEVIGPDKKGHYGNGQPYFSEVVEPKPDAGAWTVRVARADDKNVSGGGYSLALLQAPVGGASALSGAVTIGAGRSEKPGAWTFAGIAGHRMTINIQSAGGTGFSPEFFMFSPAGVFAGSMTCDGSCTDDITVPQNGNYTIIASRAAQTGTANYSLSVTEKN